MIGSISKENLKRFPSDLYWPALRAWGVRLFDASEDEYISAVPAVRAHRRQDRKASQGNASKDGASRTWHAALPEPPEPPEDFLKQTTFGLTSSEAEFLVDRIASTQPDSLLAYLAKNRLAAGCRFIWQHPSLAGFPVEMQAVIQHAEISSEVILGARLLYNLMLAEKRDRKDWVDRYRARIEKWRTLNLARVESWDLNDLWEFVGQANFRAREPLKRFTVRWRRLVLWHEGDVFNLSEARELIANREMALKGPHSRFVNHSALARWGGSSAASRLDFRWPQAKSHIKDICNAS